MLIADLDAALSSIGQVLSRVEAGGGQDRSDAPVEAFDHAVSLGGPGCDQAMIEICVGTELELGGRPAGAGLGRGSSQ